MGVSYECCSRCEECRITDHITMPCDDYLFMNVCDLIEKNEKLKHLSSEKIKEFLDCEHWICDDCLGIDDLLQECRDNDIDSIEEDKDLTEKEIDIVTKLAHFKFYCDECHKEDDEEEKKTIINNIIKNYKKMTKDKIIEEVKKLL